MDVGAEIDQSGSLRLEGQVLDPDRQPVAGARVSLDCGKRYAVCGDDGCFAFDDLAMGLYRLTARKGDLFVDIKLVTLREGREPVVLTMRPGMRLNMLVVSGASPIAGAQLVMDDEVVAVTDAQGRAELRGIGGFGWWVDVTADGFGSASVSSFFAPTDPGGTIERNVTLSRGAPVGGIVLGPGDTPVPAATVRVSGPSSHGEATTDSAGRWRLEAREAGSHRVRVRSKTHASAADLRIELDGTTPREDLVVRLIRGATVVGTVVDASGRVVARPLLELIRRDCEDHERPIIQGDDLGTFELAGLPPGTYDVFAHDGHRRASPMTRLTLVDGQSESIKLVVDSAGIAGVFTDSNGEPIAGALVRASCDFVRADMSDHSGRFDLGPFPPGDYDIQTGVATTRVAAGETSARLVLPPLTTVTGRVFLDGAPLQHFGVALTGDASKPQPEEIRGIHAADGRFTLRGVPPGERGLAIGSPTTAYYTVERIVIDGANMLDLGDIELKRGHLITGHVRDAVGAPVPEARVKIGSRTDYGRAHDPLEQWFSWDFETTTGPDGAFTFPSVPRARSIAATHPERGASVSTELPDRDATVELILLETGSIEAVVEGQAIDDLHVSVRRIGIRHDYWSAQLAPAGTFLVEQLPPGDYKVWFDRRGVIDRPTPVTVTVVASKRSTVKL